MKFVKIKRNLIRPGWDHDTTKLGFAHFTQTQAGLEHKPGGIPPKFFFLTRRKRSFDKKPLWPAKFLKIFLKLQQFFFTNKLFSDSLLSLRPGNTGNIFLQLARNIVALQIAAICCSYCFTFTPNSNKNIQFGIFAVWKTTK